MQTFLADWKIMTSVIGARREALEFRDLIHHQVFSLYDTMKLC